MFQLPIQYMLDLRTEENVCSGVKPHLCVSQVLTGSGLPSASPFSSSGCGLSVCVGVMPTTEQQERDQIAGICMMINC